MKTRRVRKFFSFLLSLVWVLAVAAPPRAQDAPAAGRKEGTPEKKERYGKPPPGLRPFGRYREAYREFFLEPTTYLGPGRKKELAVPPETVDIGLLAPLDPSSSEAPYGRSMLQGVQLAIEEANAGGGYRGLPFRLVPRNDSGAWGASSNVMARLAYEDRVWAVIGSVSGAATHVALRVALKAEIPMVNTASTDPTVTETRIPWILRCVADDRRQGYALAELIFRERKLGRVVVLRTNSRYGRLGIQEFADAARRLGHPIVLEMRFEKGATSFDVQLDRIERLSPEALVTWADASEVARILRSVRARGMKLPVFAADRAVSPELLKEAREAAEGLTATYTFHAESGDPDWVKLRSRYREKFSAEPDAFAAHGYDGARILVQAIRTGGLNRARIMDALQALRHYKGVTGWMEFDATLNDIGPVTIAEVKGGSWTYRLHQSSVALQDAER